MRFINGRRLRTVGDYHNLSAAERQARREQDAKLAERSTADEGTKQRLRGPPMTTLCRAL